MNYLPFIILNLIVGILIGVGVTVAYYETKLYKESDD